MGLFEAAGVLLLVAIVGTLAYSIYKAIQTSKKNKANDEAARRIFLAQLDGVTLNENGMPVATEAKKIAKVTMTQTISKIENGVPVNSGTKQETIVVQDGEVVSHDVKTDGDIDDWDDMPIPTNMKLKDFFES